MPTYDEPPPEIVEAARQVAEYFSERGVSRWCLEGLQPHRPGVPNPAVQSDANIVSVPELVSAIMARDRPPTTPEQGIRAAALQLGLCMLGELPARVLRLQLPTGYTLRMTLE